MSTYEEFLAAKAQLADGGGFEPLLLPDHLFGFQRLLVDWAVRQGRGALFADCGLGKTPMELAWAQNMHLRTGRPVLLLTPLAVGFQIVAEAQGKFGVDAAASRDGRPAAEVTVTNYEQLEKFDPADFRLDRVLPFRDARDEDDEKHMHPLQLDVIHRCLQLWSNPGERVLTPFAGVGSEVYEAVATGRFGIGAELKPSYYEQAIRNLQAVGTDRAETASLFELGASV